MAINIKNVASEPSMNQQVINLDSLQILRVLQGCQEPISVKEGEYKSSGTVLIYQYDPDDEKELARLHADYDRELDLQHNVGLSFDKANERDGIAWLSACYTLKFTDGKAFMQFKSATELPESDWLVYNDQDELVRRDDLTDYPTEVKLGDEMFPIMHMNPYAATALFKNVLGGLGVEKDEFPPAGEILIMIVPFDSAQERATERRNLTEMARQLNVSLRLPGPSVYRNFYGLIVGYADYEIVQQGEDEWAMVFSNPEKAPPRAVSEEGELVELDDEE